MTTSPPSAASTSAHSPEALEVPAWQLLGRSAAATALADLQGRITYVNAAFLDLWGFADASQVLGQPADGMFWADGAAARQVLQTLLASRVWQGEMLARRADGRGFPVRVTASMLAGEDGSPTALTASFIDISTERAASAALRAERQFSDAVLGAAGVLVLVLDEAGRILRFNAECERVSGRPAAEVLGRFPWDTVLPAEIADRVRADVFAATMATGRPGQKFHFTNEWCAVDGSRRLIEWTNTLLVDVDGVQRFMVSIGVDVTARHEAERARQLSEQQLEQAQAVAKLGSWHLDLRTGRLDWSPQVYALFDIEPSRFAGTYEAFLALVHPDDRDAVNQAYERSLRTREPYDLEHRLLLPDGRIKWVEERCESEFDADGRPLRSHGTVQDVTERHLRDAELRRFRHMVERAPQEVWLTDAQLRVRYANQAAAASLGYTQDELIGMSVADLDVRGEAPVLEQVRRTRGMLKSGGTTPPVEVEHRARDGRIVPKELHASIIEVDGEVLGCAFLQDITERRRVRAAQMASEAQLRAALDAYPGWVACADEQLRYVYVNEQFALAVGLPVERILGRTTADIRGPKVHAELVEIVRRMLAGERVELERRYLDADGVERTYWVQYRVTGDAAAGNLRLYAFATDIGEMRRIQLRLATVLESTGIGAWEWEAHEDHLEFSAEVSRILGFDPSELPANPAPWVMQRIHPQDRPVRKAHFVRLMAGEIPGLTCEFRVLHKDGRWIWVQERVRTVVASDSGRPVRVVGTTQDISTLKAQDEQLRTLNAELETRIEQRTHALAEAKAQAERANAAKSDFLSQMSHELRTPLNAIIGFSQLLELAPLAPAQATQVREVLRAGRHLLDLINEILDLATVESGRVPLRAEPVSLAEVTEECLQMMRPVAHREGVVIEAIAEPDDTVVRADRGRLKQVLLNLLSNAIKYNRRGGRVVVEHHGTDDAFGELQVSDTGAGLTPAQLPHLFEPFERFDAARSGIEGTGIGLSVSKRLVELMGGRIGARSEPGQGSTFWVRLPAAEGDAVAAVQQAVAQARMPGPTPASALARQKVLYVEDNLPNQQLMQDLLATRGDLELIVTDDPQQALSIACERSPALVLLDIQLPGIDGYELLSLMRSRGVTVPVIAVSANAMPRDLERGRAAGFVEYLTKPLDLRRVLEAVQAWVPASPV